MSYRAAWAGLLATILLALAPSPARAQLPVVRMCPRTTTGLPSYLYGFDANGGLLCAPITAGLEACDGVDNNINGQVDEYLFYCLSGKPAPNSDGKYCLSEWADRNRTAGDGCEYRGTMNEFATRVLGIVSYPSTTTSGTIVTIRLDGGSATPQVLSLKSGQTVLAKFSVYGTDGRIDYTGTFREAPIRPVYVDVPLPACPYAAFTEDPTHLELTIATQKGLSAGGDCQITRAFAADRTPQIVATLTFILRVAAAP